LPVFWTNFPSEILLTSFLFYLSCIPSFVTYLESFDLFLWPKARSWWILYLTTYSYRPGLPCDHWLCLVCCQSDGDTSSISQRVDRR
jgi:hypothetical protein